MGPDPAPRLDPEPFPQDTSPGNQRHAKQAPAEITHNDRSPFPTSRSPFMILLDPASIDSWHAHVYFDADSRDAAWALRKVIDEQLDARVQLGRFHERPVGPHPMWSYQLAFDGSQLTPVLGWLALNHGALDVFVHPNTGDALRDHRDCAVWIGRSHQLRLEALFG